MEFKDRLKKARERRGLNQTQLGETLGVSAQTVQQWESGKTMPRHKRIEALASKLGVRPQWLLLGQGEMQEKRGNELIFHETEIVDGDSPLAEDEVEIPYFREVEMAAGDGRTQVIENHGAYMRFSLPRLARAGVDPKQAACATVSGDSMEPAIFDGSPIGIDKSCRHIIDGKVYALDHGGMLRVKRLYRLPLGRMRVVSDNHIEYPEEVYTLGDPDAPKIIGRVFWWETFA
ncbi:XRE family transcriptional regulator [Cobetia marina]|jgi:phage repressor protein C with HTH and peptisase S24 domain|uniref:XRE family transcriptional regulator n=1 Tax=Cobetia marina TaxID=28258 RepID=UPI003A8FA101